jgi:methyltransferase (TIGR00027 family)
MDARTAESVLPIVLRTRFFDDWLADALEDARVRQVAILGAGLDTRACRLPWPHATVLFEIDHAEVLDHKADVLAAAGATPVCERRTVAADLAGDWSTSLTAAGFDADRPAAWLLEGLLFYLPVERVVRVLDAVTRLAAPGSRLGFDIVNAAVLTFPLTRPWVEMQADAGAPWLGTMEDPVSLLAERGWTASLTQAGQPDADHGRWTLPVYPPDAPGLPHSWLVTAVR